MEFIVVTFELAAEVAVCIKSCVILALSAGCRSPLKPNSVMAALLLCWTHFSLVTLRYITAVRYGKDTLLLWMASSREKSRLCS